MNPAHFAPLRLIAIAILISAASKTLASVILAANGHQERLGSLDTVLSCAFAYFVHWTTLNNVHDIGLIVSLRPTEINLKRILFFSLKLSALMLIAIVPVFFIVAIAAPFFEDAVSRGQTFAGRITYMVFSAILIGAALGYWGTWLPAAVAGRNVDFAAAAKRGKATFATSAPRIAGIILAQTIFFQIAILGFSSLAGVTSDLKVPVFEDIGMTGAFEFVTGIVGYTAYAAIAVILCRAFEQCERFERRASTRGIALRMLRRSLA
ncbi:MULTISPECIES: hypothetical protein [unclassified Rhizobium]|uniref:hypothetical protein n=1 Tax=unclassified Rhizobium TaxID=2613769 RepID=UPI000713B9D2|nr:MULTISPECIES: hypothetical protein [unclassified Rhizobium]KQS84208.1 hypothetical protein ASG50_30475 [Rhizobium sp. Leaf386]KQT00834.1 hypothetical protein ASG42_27725 [Rhizobium sp. Leaf391]KQU08483.1 hypothetical protein ASG68_23165 [Rhizobium sp. Leaf453]